MEFKALWGVINAIVLVVVSWGAFSYLVGVYSVEIEEVELKGEKPGKKFKYFCPGCETERLFEVLE